MITPWFHRIADLPLTCNILLKLTLLLAAAWALHLAIRQRNPYWRVLGGFGLCLLMYVGDQAGAFEPDALNQMDWGHYLCEARGDVTVPAGKRVRLQLNDKSGDNLAALSRLKPDDIHELWLGIKATDRCLPHLPVVRGTAATPFRQGFVRPGLPLSDCLLRNAPLFWEKGHMNVQDGTYPPLTARRGVPRAVAAVSVRRNHLSILIMPNSCYIKGVCMPSG